MALHLNLFALVSTGLFVLSGCRVIELDERFLEQRKEGMWLVEFYAPWCGHCKKLEPTFHQVAIELRNSEIKVAKLDCTRYSSVASEFGVRGFPTIKFISGDNDFTHKGERSKEDIIEFTNRASGPPVRKIPSIGKYYEVKGKIADSVMFLYIGDDDTEADLFQKYSEVAEKSRIQAYFYAGKKNILPQDIKFKNDPTVLVFKDGETYEYEAPDGIPTMASLQSWVRSERYNAFPLVQGGNINEMADTEKILVITVVDPNDEERRSLNDRVKNIVETLATKNRDQFHSKFQFLWMRDMETVNSITMSFLDSPCIVLLDTDTYLYYMLNFPLKDITTIKLSSYLNDVSSGKIPAYGGTGFFQRVKRIFYDILTTVLSVWQSSRWLFLLMFGLPTVVISIVCYSLCCMEPIDDGSPDSDEEDDEDDEIREVMKKQELPLPPTPTPPPSPVKNPDGHIKAE